MWPRNKFEIILCIDFYLAYISIFLMTPNRCDLSEKRQITDYSGDISAKIHGKRGDTWRVVMNFFEKYLPSLYNNAWLLWIQWKITCYFEIIKIFTIVTSNFLRLHIFDVHESWIMIHDPPIWHRIKLEIRAVKISNSFGPFLNFVLKNGQNHSSYFDIKTEYSEIDRTKTIYHFRATMYLGKYGDQNIKAQLTDGKKVSF